MDKLQRVLNGNDNSPDAGNPSIMNEVSFRFDYYHLKDSMWYHLQINLLMDMSACGIILNSLFDFF